MEAVKIALIREGKTPVDRRVALTPEQAQILQQRFPYVQVICQPSTWRCFTDEAYREAGIEVRENIQDCDYLLGIKEVPVATLLSHKTYLFFSHTIKKQAHNRKLLQAVIEKHIRLIDYECLTDAEGERLIAFGWFAGVVGAYNGLYTYGQKFGLYTLKRAKDCEDLEELKHECRRLRLPRLKIAITGKGRVASGAVTMLQAAGVSEVSPADYLQHTFEKPVYTQLDVLDYNRRKDGSAFSKQEFYRHPERFCTAFLPYTQVTDIFIAAAYWDSRAPALFSREDMLQPGFKMHVIADVTCDIEGSVPSTKKASTIADPVYDYDPVHDLVVEPPFGDASLVSVMAIDNLPSELPKDASCAFGEKMLSEVMPALLQHDKQGIIKRATIAEDGALTEPYRYLQDYIQQKA